MIPVVWGGFTAMSFLSAPASVCLTIAPVSDEAHVTLHHNVRFLWKSQERGQTHLFFSCVLRLPTRLLEKKNPEMFLHAEDDSVCWARSVI